MQNSEHDSSIFCLCTKETKLLVLYPKVKHDLVLGTFFIIIKSYPIPNDLLFVCIMSTDIDCN